jgi:Fe-Mn family superoxide dismutase
VTRRQALAALALGGAGVAIAAAGGAAERRSMARPEEPPSAAAAGSDAGVPAGRHPIVPLPFDPARLRGLSERLLSSHHQNNYAGAVKNLNAVEEALARLDRDSPAYLVGALRQRELVYTNSVILHELYFANLGGDGKPSGAIVEALSAAPGGMARWEEQFRATGMSLGGGSGWAVLACNLHSGGLRTYWAGDHSQSAAFGHPLLVLDMYEHAYHLDYGAAVARYIDAFFHNVRWDEVNRRLERARRAAAVSRA